MPGDKLILMDGSVDQDILRSELWTTLFRGGYMMGKLQRSLSGKFVSSVCLLSFIHSLFTFYDCRLKFVSVRWKCLQDCLQSEALYKVKICLDEFLIYLHCVAVQSKIICKIVKDKHACTHTHTPTHT